MLQTYKATHTRLMEDVLQDLVLPGVSHTAAESTEALRPNHSTFEGHAPGTGAGEGRETAASRCNIHQLLSLFTFIEHEADITLACRDRVWKASPLSPLRQRAEN